MSVEVKEDGTTIAMTRGDTVFIHVTAERDDGTEYIPEPGDTARFAMKHPKMTSGKKGYADEEPLLVIPIPTSTMLLTIEPEDTKPFDFNSYVYDIEITSASGKVSTIIPKKPEETAWFIIAPEVD